MKIIPKRTLDKLLEKIGQEQYTLQDDPMIVPWNWLGDDFMQTIRGCYGLNLPKENRAGYCLSLKQGIKLDSDGELFWPHFVGFYSARSNSACESVGITYGLYLEGEEHHMWIALSGWEIGRLRGSKHNAGLTMGTVDYNRRVVYGHYPAIKEAILVLGRLLMVREQSRGDSYLACFATHHLYDELYGTQNSDPIRDMDLDTNRPLNQLVWGK